MGSLLLLQERKTFDVSTLVRIDPVPQTQKLIKEKKYVEAEEYLSYFMEHPYVKENPKAQKLLKQIQEKRNSYEYKKDKLIEGVTTGGSDENIGRISAIVSDFLVIGDIRDLSIEGNHYAHDKKVDKLMVALSSLGLLATGSTIYTLGATTPIKTSISFLKYGKKINKIPTWFQKALIEEAKIAKNSNSLKNISKLLAPMNKLYEKVGLNQTLNILKISKNAKELKALVNFSSRFGKKSHVLLTTTNNQALHYAKMMPNVSNRSFLLASTYGERGLRGLKKVGEKKFIKRVAFNSHFIKSAYKGNFNPLINYLLKHISNTVLFATVFFGLFYFMRKFFFLAKKIF
jgi:hypothetical protein